AGLQCANAGKPSRIVIVVEIRSSDALNGPQRVSPRAQPAGHSSQGKLDADLAVVVGVIRTIEAPAAIDEIVAAAALEHLRNVRRVVAAEQYVREIGTANIVYAAERIAPDRVIAL